MSEWRKVRLGDICTKIGSGATPKGGGESYQLSGISFIRSQNVLDWQFSPRGLAFINEEQANKLKNVIIEKDDVLLNITGDSVARACIVPSSVLPARVNQHVAIVRVDKVKADAFFILCVLQFIKTYLFGISSSGGTRNALTKVMIGNLEINLPSLAEQKRIAAILGSLDDKIELNNRINKNLEEQASALFKRWFVDFEFPDTNGNPYKSAGGKFIDSPLGAIPEGWRVGKLGDIISIFDSKRVPLSNQQRAAMDKVYPYYGAASLMDFVDNYIFDGKYLLLGEDGTVITDNGFPILQYVWGKFWVNNHAHIMQGNNGFTTETLYTLLKYKNVSSIVTGAVQPKINQANLKNIDIIIPSKTILEKFNNFTKELFTVYRNNIEEIRNLSQLRDSILPKLMNNKFKLY